MSYRHITSEQRAVLAALIRAKTQQKKIAAELKKHRTTIWRERTRNAGSDLRYRATHAKQKTATRRYLANQRFRRLNDDPALQRYIIRKIKLYWSPEEIAGRLRTIHGRTIIHHQTIYTFIYEKHPYLTRYLRCQKGKFRRRRGTKKRAKAREEAKKRRINTRPQIVDQRTRLGDWEGDTVVGPRGDKSALLTYVERKSGFLLADKLVRALAALTRTATVQRFNRLPPWLRRTCTYDNGSEFAEHERTEIALKHKTLIYFAHPYHSWERGTNENTNGLLRQFFPKKKSLATVTQAHLDRVVHLINNRPRKRLHYLTPSEVFRGRCTLD